MAQNFSPRWRIWATTLSMPCLLIVLRPLADTLRVIHRFSDGTQNRCLWTFGFHRRRVLRCEWDTLLPNDGRRPVTWQTLDIGNHVTGPATATGKRIGAVAPNLDNDLWSRSG